MRTLPTVCASATLLLASAATAAACPVCDSDAGRTVRAGIFGDDFGTNVLLTLLPFPVLFGVVALIHFAFPNPRLSVGDGTTATDEGAAR